MCSHTNTFQKQEPIISRNHIFFDLLRINVRNQDKVSENITIFLPIFCIFTLMREQRLFSTKPQDIDNSEKDVFVLTMVSKEIDRHLHSIQIGMNHNADR